MATVDDLRRVALAYPGVVEGTGPQLGYSVMVKGKAKGVCWEWMERVSPRKKKEPNPGVYAFRVPSLGVKEAVLQSGDPSRFVQDSHYDGYPAVLVRLEAVTVEELGELFEEGYRCLAP